MKLFNDLKQNQAVKLDNGLFVVELYQGAYEISGVQVNINYGNNQVTVQSLDDIKRITTKSGELLNYVYTHNGITDIVSVDERNALAVKVDDFSDEYYYEDAEEHIFPDLYIEFEYKKLRQLLNSYRPVRAPDVTTLESVEVTVVGTAVVTGSQFIETPFQYGTVSFSGRGVFRVNLSAIALDEFNRAKLVYTNSKFDNATHSNIRYAQVNGNYLFNDDVLGAKENQVRIFGSLKEAQAMEKEVRDGISNILRHKLAPVAMTALTVNNVMNELETIRNNVKRIDPKSKSYDDHARAIKQLNELVAKLMKVE
jgi:hypothetical protein